MTKLLTRLRLLRYRQTTTDLRLAMVGSGRVSENFEALGRAPDKGIRAAMDVQDCRKFITEDAPAQPASVTLFKGRAAMAPLAWVPVLQQRCIAR